jgi:processive 1,2-diacylglycerol beta-glucosyltransferase
MRVLILHASAGAGHARAAEAIAKAYAALEHPPEVRVLDALDFAPPWFGRLYRGSFEASVRHAPWLFAAAYHGSSRAVRFAGFRWLRRRFNRVAARELVRAVARFAPDVVLCTHMLPLDALLREKARGRLEAPVACVVTDYVAHGYWIERLADRTYVASAETAAELAARGVERGRIRVSGIPIDPAFAEAPAREAARGALGIGAGRRAVLVLAGGLGMGPLVDVVRSLGARAAPVELLIVCGKNAALRAEVERLAPSLAVPARVFGFVDAMPALMAAADVVVTKSGGLTTTEALAVGRPLLLFEAMPGQEAGNARHLERAGAAIRVEPAEAGAALAALLADPGRLLALAERARAAGRPDAARRIAEDALGLARIEALAA